MLDQGERPAGVYLGSLDAGSATDLETKNRHYRSEYLRGLIKPGGFFMSNGKSINENEVRGFLLGLAIGLVVGIIVKERSEDYPRRLRESPKPTELHSQAS
jgi:hypothetical protein